MLEILELCSVVYAYSFPHFKLNQNHFNYLLCKHICTYTDIIYFHDCNTLHVLHWIYWINESCESWILNLWVSKRWVGIGMGHPPRGGGWLLCGAEYKKHWVCCTQEPFYCIWAIIKEIEKSEQNRKWFLGTLPFSTSCECNIKQWIEVNWISMWSARFKLSV